MKSRTGGFGGRAAKPCSARFAVWYDDARKPSSKESHTDTRQTIRLLLNRVASGESAAVADLLPIVYAELRQLAGSFFRNQQSGNTLQPTALVHEAYLKLVDQSIPWTGRNQFFAVAAAAMRSILIDHARARNRAKRGGGRQRVGLHGDLLGRAAPDAPDQPIEEIDAALSRLAELDERKARLVELRFFGGLTLEQTAEVLGLARSTAAEEWRLARAWLHSQLRDVLP